MRKLLLFIAIISMFTTVSFSQHSNIKQNMLKRLPKINNLKNQGLIGENNKGFLELRTENHSMANLVKTENSDRLKIYKIIASKTKGTAELVGKVRAEKIAKNSPKGHWLQNPAGKWYRK